MRPLFVPAALVALTVACGGGNTPTGPGTDAAAANVVLSNGFMNARIDGARGVPTQRRVTSGIFDVTF